MAAENVTAEEIESKAEQINTLAREAPDDALYPPEYDDVTVDHLCRTVANWMEREGDVHFYWEETLLSKREAEVVALKKRGFSHDGIALFYTVLNKSPNYDGPDFCDGPSSTSTIDEYSRRARMKGRKGGATHAMVQSLYDL